MRRPHPLSLILIVLWLTSMAIFVTAPFKLLILLLLCVLGVLMFSGVQASALAKSLLKLLPLLLGVFIIQVLATRGGTELFTLGFVSITDAGLLRALGLMLRVSIIFISAKMLARLS